LNILVIDRAPPGSDRQGNELIARHIVPLLRADHRLVLLAPVLAGQEAAARQRMDGMFDGVRLVTRSRRITSLLGWFEPWLARRGIPGTSRLDGRAAKRFRAEIREILSAESIDVVHVRQLPMSAYATDLGRTPRLLELVDAETLATSRIRRRRLRTAIRHRIAVAIERRALKDFAIVTVVAEADASALRDLRPASRVEVVPNGVDTTHFRPQPEIAVTPGSIVFVGAMSFGPNVAAVGWFVSDVLPLIRASRGDVHLSIVGRDPGPEVCDLALDPAVTVTGEVDDVRPFLSRAEVVVAPMVDGGGIKNKILEAFAMQRPVVATPLGAEGIAVRPGQDLLVAEGPEAFATAVVALLADANRAAQIAAAGRALVVSRYTWGACARRYAELYADLAGRPPSADGDTPVSEPGAFQ
jgi:polysaccharide biosynthesis protein PslH